MVNNFIFIFIHKRFERNKFNLLTNVLSQTSLNLKKYIYFRICSKAFEHFKVICYRIQNEKGDSIVELALIGENLMMLILRLMA